MDRSNIEKEFESISEIRLEFYPESAGLLDIDAEDIVGLPFQLNKESLRAIESGASKAPGRRGPRTA